MSKTNARWERLPFSPPLKTLYKYYVTGYGDFPMDMLRYDSCWPAGPTDVAKLGAEHKERSVQLCSTQEPTLDRWTSFGWRVGTENLIT